MGVVIRRPGSCVGVVRSAAGARRRATRRGGRRRGSGRGGGGGAAARGGGLEGLLTGAPAAGGGPGAVTLVPAMPIWGLAAAGTGGLWFCLWRGTWRWTGAPVFALALLNPLFSSSPDLLVDGGYVALTARTLADVVSRSINMGGIIEARAVDQIGLFLDVRARRTGRRRRRLAYARLV